MTFFLSCKNTLLFGEIVPAGPLPQRQNHTALAPEICNRLNLLKRHRWLGANLIINHDLALANFKHHFCASVRHNWARPAALHARTKLLESVLWAAIFFLRRRYLQLLAALAVAQQNHAF